MNYLFFQNTQNPKIPRSPRLPGRPTICLHRAIITSHTNKSHAFFDGWLLVDSENVLIRNLVALISMARPTGCRWAVPRRAWTCGGAGHAEARARDWWWSTDGACARLPPGKAWGSTEGRAPCARMVWSLFPFCVCLSKMVQSYEKISRITNENSL